MSASPSGQSYSLEEYLRLAEGTDHRLEYLNGEIFAMAGATLEHSRLCQALSLELGGQLRNRTCRPYGQDLRVYVAAASLLAHPDLSVICGEPVLRDGSMDATNPTVIIEVLSKSTEKYDRGRKRENYQLLDSLRDYVLVDQYRRRIEVFSRSDASQPWALRAHGAGDTVSLASVGVTFGVDELYALAGVDVA